MTKSPSYLFGVFLFVLAYFALMAFLVGQTPGFYGRVTYDPKFDSPFWIAALALSGCSLGVWFYASIRVAIAIFKFSR